MQALEVGVTSMKLELLAFGERSYLKHVIGTLKRGCMRQFLKTQLEKFSLNFPSCSVNFKMALTGGGNHGEK